jgi:hypothetical protein
MSRVVKGLSFCLLLALVPGAQAVPSPFSDANNLTPLEQVVKDPLISLMDGQATRNLQVAHFNALRSLSFAGLGGLSDLTASGLRASDAVDTALPSIDPIGVAMFKTRVVDDLVSALDEMTALTGEDYLATDTTPIYDEDAVISGIFQVDSSEWGDTWTEAVSQAVIDAGEVADPSNVTVVPDEPQIAEADGESPLTSDGSDELNYAAGHFISTPQWTNSTHTRADTSDFSGFHYQYSFGASSKPRVAHHASVPLTQSMNLDLASLPDEPLIVVKSNATTGGNVSAVPLPRSVYAGAITLVGLFFLRSSRRVRRLISVS